MKKNKYVHPQLIQEELKRMNMISEYNYFTSLSEEDDNKIDQLTMDDFQSSQGDAPEGGAPQGGAPEGGAPEGVSPEGGAPAPEMGGEEPTDNPFGEAPPAEGEPEAPMGGEEGTQEIDVTDIVQSAKATEQQTTELSSKVDQTMNLVQDLLNKIGAMEGNVTKMDQALAKIDAVYKELELMKPPSPEETKEIMAQNSYPFNVRLEKYGEEGTPQNQTELEQRKNKLSLSNLLNDFNERDIRQSFNPPDPFADKLSQSLPSYRI